jgi:hypothetical protein
LAKRKKTPEEREAFRRQLAEWAEDRRRWAEKLEAHAHALRERRERRRHLINRLSLGLLARR